MKQADYIDDIGNSFTTIFHEIISGLGTIVWNKNILNE